MIPLFHDLQDERVVIFGGGPVAARKAGYFGREAEVVVVSETFVDRIGNIDCQKVRASITLSLVDSFVTDAFLVIPATDDKSLNRDIEDRARMADALVNSVDHAGDTITPSTVEGRLLTVAISTHGASPATSKYLRQCLEPEIERIDAMADLQADLRDVLGNRAPSERREVLWRVLQDDRVWEALASDETERARILARKHV